MYLVRNIGSLILGILIIFSADANAALISYSDRATFESQGNISQYYDFEDFGAYPAYPGTPWTTHGVTYSSQQNTVFFGSLGGNPPVVSHVLTTNYWLYISGSLDTTSQMLGFDLAVLFATAVPGNVTLNVLTNQATYTLGNLGLPDVSSGEKFFGFVSTGAERIVGFSLTSDTWGTGPTIDNVTLGTTTAVPEPTTYFLLLVGIIPLLLNSSLTDRGRTTRA